MPTTAPPAPKSPAPPTPPVHGPWRAAEPWGSHWPTTGRPPTRSAVIAVLVAGIVGALAIPLDRPGAGWLVAALAGTAAVVVPRFFPDAPVPDAPQPLVVRPVARSGPDGFGWAAATVALFAVGTLRSAGWLFVLCLLTATLTGTLALTGGRSTRSIAAGYSMQVIAAFRALPWLARGAQRVRRRGDGPNVRILATVSASVLLLVVFGALFASADPAFAGVLSALAPDFSAYTLFRWA